MFCTSFRGAHGQGPRLPNPKALQDRRNGWNARRHCIQHNPFPTPNSQTLGRANCIRAILSSECPTHTRNSLDGRAPFSSWLSSADLASCEPSCSDPGALGSSLPFLSSCERLANLADGRRSTRRSWGATPYECGVDEARTIIGGYTRMNQDPSKIMLRGQKLALVHCREPIRGANDDLLRLTV
jgi:hypothetical protein